MIPDETQIPSMTFKIFASQRLRKNVGRVVHTRHFDELDDTFFKGFVYLVSANANVLVFVLHVGQFRHVYRRLVVAVELDRQIDRHFDLLGEDEEPLELFARIVCCEILCSEYRIRHSALLAGGPGHRAIT